MKRLKNLTAGLIAFTLAAVVSGCKKTDETKNDKFINSLAVVRFSEGERVSNAKSVTEEVFFRDENSVKNYVEKISGGKANYTTVSLEICELKTSVKRYLPAYKSINGEYELINEEGYDNRITGENGEVSRGGENSGRFIAEQELVREIGESLRTDLPNDGDGDGFADLVTVVFDLKSQDADTVLALASSGIFNAHQGEYYAGKFSYGDEEITFGEVKAGGAKIGKYVFMPLGSIYKEGRKYYAAACHETLHAFGATDMYTADGLTEPVGAIDVMGNVPLEKLTVNPVYPLSYTREKLGFIGGENLRAVIKSGEYTLFPTESEKSEIKAYKIVPPDFFEIRDCFYVEYRKSEGDGKPNFDGLIIYRVNGGNGYIQRDGGYGKTYNGNLYGENEVYVFRFKEANEDDKTFDGANCFATLSSESGRTTFGSETNGENLITYSDKTNSGIVVNFLKNNPDGSVTFSVKLPEYDVKTPAEVDYREIFVDKGGNLKLDFYRPLASGNAYVVQTEKPIIRPSAKKIKSGKYGSVKVLPSAFMETELSYEGNYVYLAFDDTDEIKSYVLKKS